MDVSEMTIDLLIEYGHLIRVEEITTDPKQVYVLLTEPDGSESLYRYEPEPISN